MVFVTLVTAKNETPVVRVRAREKHLTSISSRATLTWRA